MENEVIKDNNEALQVESLSPTNNKLKKEEKKDKSNKMDKVKTSKNQELGDLEKNEILPSRLRSVSGRVYSSGMVIETPTQAVTELAVLNEEPKQITSSEIEDLTGEVAAINMQRTCSDSECCKNTTKIVSLITKLQKSVDEIKENNTRQNNYTTSISNDVREIEDKVDENVNEISAIKKELIDYRFQLRLVENVVAKQDQQIQFLNKKINDMQQREMFPNIIITGIPESDKENPIQKFNRFVSENLKIQELIPAHRAYRLGNGNQRPLLVELRDPLTYKPRIYANVSNLKGQRNSQGGMFFVSDHLPDEYNEIRRRSNEIFSENKKKDHSVKANMSVKRGRLLIDNKPYEKAVRPPGPKDIFRPDDAQMDLADEIDMVKGKPEAHARSTFVAYATAVKDYEDIQAAYTKVRTKFADATHVVCSWRLPGNDSHNLQDFVDDGEYGAGRAVLGVMKEECIMNAVIFMIRHHGGQNIGAIRYEIFKKVARSSIQALRRKIELQKEKEKAEKAAEEERQKQLGAGWPTPEPIPVATDWSDKKQD